MKNLFKYFVLFSLIFQSVKISANSILISKEDSLVYLEIRGKIVIKENDQKNTKNSIYKVELIENNKVIDSILENDNELFVFGLLKNKYYALKVYKTGYVPKLIIVNTFIPEKKYLTDYFIFDFETDLLKVSEEEKLDQDTKDFPLAIVQFDVIKKAFNYNQQYSKNIKQSLYLRKE